MKQRVISAIIMIVIFVPFLLLGGWPFYCFISVLGLGATYELLNTHRKIPIITKIFTYLSVLSLILINAWDKNLIITIDSRILILIMFFLLGSLVFVKNLKTYHYKDAFLLIGISLFIGIGFHNFLLVRNNSIYLLLYLMSITVATDSFAYIIGSKFGRHKLAPLISPNKTIEGFVAGSVLGTIIGSLLYFFLLRETESIFVIIACTFFLSLVGQIGDLIKSAIKRYAGIKDFSNLIKGHGGILDRLDSILFAVMAYILICGLL